MTYIKSNNVFLENKESSISSDFFNRNSKGFTLIEALISIGIIAVISSFAFVNFASYKSKHSFDLDVQNISEAIRSAQNRSINQEQGNFWSIKFTNSTSSDDYYEIFPGSSYSTSTVIIRESLSYASQLTNPASGFTKTISFSAIYGKPTIADSLTVKHNASTNTATIFINSFGKINVSETSDLVGHWSLDEGIETTSATTSYDSSGKNNSGNISIGAGGDQATVSAAWSAGLLGKLASSLSLDGTDDYVTASSSDSLLLSNTGTVSVWVKRATVKSTTVGVVFKGVGFSSYGQISYLLYIDSNVPKIYICSGSAANIASKSITWNTNWHHLVGVWNGSQVIMYVDGVAGTPVSQTINAQGITSHPLLIGSGQSNGLAYDFKGLIDDVRIYNRALSPTEILNLYNSY